MASPAVDMRSGTSFVQGSVAGWATQPVGYEIEKPCRPEVNVSVNGGGVLETDADGATTEGETVGDAGDAVGAAPGPEAAGVPSNRAPTRAITMTAAAPRPIGISLFMNGVLHGPKTTRCRLRSTL